MSHSKTSNDNALLFTEGDSCPSRRLSSKQDLASTGGPNLNGTAKHLRRGKPASIKVSDYGLLRGGHTCKHRDAESCYVQGSMQAGDLPIIWNVLSAAKVPDVRTFLRQE